MHANNACMPWEDVIGAIDCPRDDKGHVHLGTSSAVQVEAISHPDRPRKSTAGWYVDAKVVIVVEEINLEVVIKRDSESSVVYVLMSNSILSHPGFGYIKKFAETLNRYSGRKFGAWRTEGDEEMDRKMLPRHG